MRVAIDTSATLFDPGGTSRYIDEVWKRRDAIEGVELVEVNMAVAWPWTRRLPRQARILLHDLAWIPRGVGSAANRAHADVLHGPAFRVPAKAPMAMVVSIHDDTPWDDPPSASWWTRTSLRRILRSAAPSVALALVAVEVMAARVRGLLPELGARVRVTPYGIDHERFHPLPEAEVRARLARLEVSGRYVLMVAPHGPRKNFQAMCTALSEAGAMEAGVRLVVVGRGPASGDQPELPRQRLERVDDENLAALYAGAEFLFFASLKEGFGFPLLEAMACGCPVLASSGTVLEEIAGGAALLADPHDADAMAEAARHLLADGELRARLHAAGLEQAAKFTWERTLELTAAAWREAAGA